MPVTSRFASVAALGLLVISSAAASSIFIPVANFSFENLPAGGLLACGPGCSYSVGAIPSWTSTSTSGVFRPGTPATSFFHTLSAGITSAYEDTAGILSQTVASAVVVPGTTYTLQVDLGRRTDLPMTASADLLVNGNHYAATGTNPTAGNWSTFTATYVGLAGDAGLPIRIELLSSGRQANFDDVRLSSVTPAGTVPEPTGATLIGLGLAGLLAFAKRKRAS